MIPSAIPEHLRDESLMINHDTNMQLLYFCTITEMVVTFAACQGTTTSPSDSGSVPHSSTAESAQAAAAAADASALSQFAQYVLHPPLPAVVGSAVTSSDQLSAIPLLLNPDILQSSKIPVITPQLTQVET